MATTYKVYITPKSGPGDVYGTELDVTDRMMIKGIANVRRAIDSTDYDIGVYTYDDLKIRAVNINGYFNDESDVRSIFFWGRDLAKVRVVFSNSDGDTITFRGLINDEATRLNSEGDEIEFRVLSRDSVIRNTKVSGGLISDGYTVTQALYAVLSDPQISSVLTVDVANINPDLNYVIDDGSQFANQSAREVLSALLFAANSVLLVDSTDTVIVRNRDEDTTRSILTLYGPFNINGHQNVIRVNDYNNGLQRRITSFKINDTEYSDTAFVETYGFKQKSKSLDFITDTTKALEIATNLVNEFKVPKLELKVDIASKDARSVQLLDRVSLDYPLRLKPKPGTFMPVVGTAKIDDASTPLPDAFGGFEISRNIGFKVIEIIENPQEFITTLKLRQIGQTLSDGWFTTPLSCAIVGFAVIGDAVICGDGDPCDAYNPAVIGSAKIGCTVLA